MELKKQYFRRTFLAFAGGLLLFLALPTGAAAEATEQQILVDEAVITFKTFMKTESMEWLRQNLYQAQGLLIVPSLLKGGLILGGSGGTGVLIVKNAKTGQWSQPAFYTIGSASLGLQIGVEASQVIMMVRTQNAVDKLLTSSFKLGGDTSIAVGPMGGGVKSNVMADIYSFALSKGAYAGASLEGAVVSVKDKWNEAYYGRAVRPIDIFVDGVVSNPGSTELRRRVAEAAQKQ